jgi:hypothetical protein
MPNILPIAATHLSNRQSTNSASCCTGSLTHTNVRGRRGERAAPYAVHTAAYALRGQRAEHGTLPPRVPSLATHPQSHVPRQTGSGRSTGDGAPASGFGCSFRCATSTTRPGTDPRLIARCAVASASTILIGRKRHSIAIPVASWQWSPWRLAIPRKELEDLLDTGDVGDCDADRVSTSRPFTDTDASLECPVAQARSGS